MNPLLLKPQSEVGAQVVVRGRVHGTAKAAAYQYMKAELMPVVLDSFARLKGVRTIKLESEAGGIELELPHEADVELEATSTAGQVECAIPGMTFEQTGSARVGRLRLGAAPPEKTTTLHATSVGGAIRVRRAPR